MGKVIASQQILMEKIIPGMLFGKQSRHYWFRLGCWDAYAALRFSVKKNKLGAWIFLEIRRDRQNTPGILLIQKIGSFTQQTGTLEVENIKPLRDYFFYLTPPFYVNANGHQKTIENP
jgi:hypothetical protein